MTIKKCLFPAAGYGTRFLPATKAMPPIVNKPLMQYGVEEALEANLTHIAVVTGRGKRAIADYFDVSYELEDQIKGSTKEALLTPIREILDQTVFSFTRQKSMKGLGHAILTGETLIGNEPFAVVLADDLCVGKGSGVLSQMVALYEKHQCSIVALEEVPMSETNKYGVISGTQIEDNLYEITHMVEKPHPDEAPSRLLLVATFSHLIFLIFYSTHLQEKIMRSK